MSFIFILDQYDQENLYLKFVPGIGGTEFNQLHEFCKQFKERKWRVDSKTNERGWQIPLNDETLEHITSHYVEGKDYDITENARYMVYYRKLSRKLDEKKASKRWDYLFDNKDTGFNYPSVREPFGHQRIAVEAMKDSEYFGLLMEMGTGKSKCIVDELEFYLRDIKEGEHVRALIVCPKSLRKNWQREFEANICGLHNYQLAILDGILGGAEALVELVQSTARLKIAIVSYDSVRGMLETLQIFQPHYLALDESHYIKNSESKRFKSIRKVAKIAQQRRILTGTPVSNNILDLWSQFEILAPGILGYNTFAGFKREFCELSKSANVGGRQFEKIEGFKNLDKLKEAMARVSFIVRKERCLTLPETLYETVRVEMPPKLRAIYDEFESNFSASISAGTIIETDFIVVQMLKLSQLCCGFAVGNNISGDEVTHSTSPIEGGDAKLTQMIEDAKELCATSKLIIWARFHFDIDCIVARLRGENIDALGFDGRTKDADRQIAVDRFNTDSSLRVLVAHPGAGGVGLTLLGNQADGYESDRCKNTFFYSNGFSFGQREQAEARNHRIGQRNPVLYRDYVYENTIEETIAVALQNKRDLANCIKDVTSIQALLQRRLE